MPRKQTTKRTKTAANKGKGDESQNDSAKKMKSDEDSVLEAQDESQDTQSTNSFTSAVQITENDTKIPGGENKVSYEDQTYLKRTGKPGTLVMLAQKYTDDTEPKGWWMSEKLDGLRAFWNGNNFYSRLGNKFDAPKYFTKNFPKDIQLDGELFLDRGQFPKAVSIVKTHGVDKGWKNLKFEIFDAPNIEAAFEDRIEAIADYFDKNSNPYVHVLEHVLCKGKEHVDEQLKLVEAVNGEGLMIREAGSEYEFGVRSSTLLKIKSFYDAEAIVIGYEPGKGRNTGVVGALRCKMESGIEFSVGSGLNDADRRKPPKKGSIITYRFQELTKSKKPRFPTFVGVRIDADKPKDAVLPTGKTV
ncbi:DNA ligase-like [Antedon mediterranea]|uniref:DNA ligase-like n=1 Tax=Antedon mediterranea TaxID=105859 RepID=UPI003AF94A78